MKRTLLAVFMALLVGSVFAAPTIINTSPLTGPDTTRADIVWKGDLASAVSSLAMGQAEENSVQVFAESLNVLLAQDLALVGGGVISAGTRREPLREVFHRPEIPAQDPVDGGTPEGKENQEEKNGFH